MSLDLNYLKSVNKKKVSKNLLKLRDSGNKYYEIIKELFIEKEKRPNINFPKADDYMKDEIVNYTFYNIYNFLKTVYSIFNKNGLDNKKIKFFMSLRFYNDKYYVINSLFQKPSDYSKTINKSQIDSLIPRAVGFINLDTNFLESQVYEIDELFEMIEPNDLVHNFIYEFSNQKDLRILEISFQILHHFENYIKKHLQSSMTSLFLNYNYNETLKGFYKGNKNINFIILKMLSGVENYVNKNLKSIDYNKHHIFDKELFDFEKKYLNNLKIEAKFISKGGNLIKLLMDPEIKYNSQFYLSDYSKYLENLSDWDFDIKINYKNPLNKMDFIEENKDICDNRHNYIHQLLKKFINSSIIKYFLNIKEIQPEKYNNILEKHIKNCINYLYVYDSRNDMLKDNAYKFILNSHGGCHVCENFKIPENFEIIQFQSIGEVCSNPKAVELRENIIDNNEPQSKKYKFPSSYPNYIITRDRHGHFKANIEFIKPNGEVEEIFDIHTLLEGAQPGQTLNLQDIIITIKEYLLSTSGITLEDFMTHKIRLYLLICTTTQLSTAEVSDENSGSLKQINLHSFIKFSKVNNYSSEFSLDHNLCTQEGIFFKKYLGNYTYVESKPHDNTISFFSSKYIGSPSEKSMFDLSRAFIGIKLEHLIFSSKIEILDFGFEIFNSNSYFISQGNKEYEKYVIKLNTKEFVLNGKTPEYLVHELINILIQGNSKINKRLIRLFKLIENIFNNIPFCIPNIFLTSFKYYENLFLKINKQRIKQKGIIETDKLYYNVNLIDAFIFLFIVKNFEIKKYVNDYKDFKFFKMINSIFNDVYDNYILPNIRTYDGLNQQEFSKKFNKHKLKLKKKNIYRNSIIKYRREHKFYSITSFLQGTDLQYLIFYYFIYLNNKFGIEKVTGIENILIDGIQDEQIIEDFINFRDILYKDEILPRPSPIKRNRRSTWLGGGSDFNF
jgi:hypothetical protein